MMGQRPFDGHKSYRVWCTDPSHLSSRDVSPDAFGIDNCVAEIESGKYHAIIVVDFSNDEDKENFEGYLGDHLQKFAAAGGVIAFPSSESILVSSLKQLFDVKWERSSYYRTNWSPCEENMEKINYSFGNGNFARRIIKPYSAKGNTLKSVPTHERCFGVGNDSKTWSPVPTMSGRDVSKGSNDDYDIIVAMHEYGKGIIAYFGDVNAEAETLWLVAAFIESRSPKVPIDVFSALSESDFTEVMQCKENGNIAFGASDLDRAETQYKAALDIFGSRRGSNGLQRENYVALLSNLSLIYLKKKLYYEAETAAGKGLAVEWGHSKCSYRRAMARLQISLNTEGGDLPRLRKASSDVINSDPGDATRKLLLRIEKEEKKLRKRERPHFSSSFASAMSGTL
mmetsp:Transcript_5103/g.5799  ORF Transcript_5103/g.5799 Transcript_5103/m.5799 type:complete len:397 (+) Transcript_5103:132-1322(+)